MEKAEQYYRDLTQHRVAHERTILQHTCALALGYTIHLKVSMPTAEGKQPAGGCLGQYPDQ